MIKILFVGVFLWLMAFWVVYLYFLYTGNPSILRDRIQTYQLYTAIFFVSLVVVYALQWDNKLLRFLMLVIIIINLFILWDVFFRNNIGLNSEQFLTLFGLLLLALAVTYITHWIRYILMIIIWLGIAFVLLTGILPLYENIPSISDFIQWQKTRIINQWTANEGTLLIKNALGTKEIPVNELGQNDIDLSQKTQISFVSKTQSESEKIFIDLWNGSFININPQSAVTLEQSGNNVIMQILQWNIEYYTPPDFSWTLQLIGKYKGQMIQDIQDNVRAKLTSQFEQKKKDFFINQLWGTMVFNPVIDKIIKFFITTLYNISPKIYQKNLTNYDNIQQYLGKSITGSTNSATTGESIRSMLNDIMSQVKKWAGETTLLNQLLNK